jgi:hypothetical protein
MPAATLDALKELLTTTLTDVFAAQDLLEQQIRARACLFDRDPRFEPPN